MDIYYILNHDENEEQIDEIIQQQNTELIQESDETIQNPVEKIIQQPKSDIPNILYANFIEYKSNGRPRRYDLEKIKLPTIDIVKKNFINILDENNLIEWFKKCSIIGMQKPKQHQINIIKSFKSIYEILFNGVHYIKENHIDFKNFTILYILHTRKPPSQNRRGPIRKLHYATIVHIIVTHNNNIKYHI